PPSIMPRLQKHLTDDKLPAAQRKRIVDILATSGGPEAGTVMLNVLQTNPPADVRDRVIENLKLFLPGKWKELRKSPEFAKAIDGLLANPQARAAGLDLIAASEWTDALGKVADIARNADKNAATRRAAVRALGAIPDDRSVDYLSSLLKDGPKAFHAEVVKSLGRLAQRKKDQPGVQAALRVLQTLVQIVNGDAAIQAAALEALTGSREGTIWLLDYHNERSLPGQLSPQAARLLRNSPYQDLRNRAMLA